MAPLKDFLKCCIPMRANRELPEEVASGPRRQAADRDGSEKDRKSSKSLFVHPSGTGASIAGGCREKSEEDTVSRKDIPVPHAEDSQACSLLHNGVGSHSSHQCLGTTPPIAEGSVMREADLMNGIDSVKLNLDNPMGSHGAVAREFHRVVVRMWPTAEKPPHTVIGATSNQTKLSPMNVSTFKAAFGRFASEFDNYSQQDAQEFLVRLLDALHEDTNTVKWPKPVILPGSPPVLDYGGDRERMPHKIQIGTYVVPLFAELADIAQRPMYDQALDDAVGGEPMVAMQRWKQYLKRDRSFFVDLLMGQMKSRVECQECGHTSIRYEPFMYLSLPLRQPGPHGKVCTSLEEAIDAFHKPEKLTGDNQWYCDHCKAHCDSIRTLSVFVVPPVLIVHLKRFQKTDTHVLGSTRLGSLCCLASKIKTLAVSGTTLVWQVDCSLDGIRIGDYCEQTYSVFAVINHNGSLRSGHYTATCRNRTDGKWYNFDDETVTEVKGSDVITEQAIAVDEMGKIRLKSSGDSAPSGRIKIEPGSSVTKRKRSESTAEPAPSVVPLVSTHSAGGRVSLMVTESQGKDSAVVHGTSPVLEEALLVGQRGKEDRTIPIGKHVLSFLKRRKGFELEKVLYEFGRQVNSDLAKAEDAKTTKSEGAASESPMSPEARDSFMDATVMEEQARKKETLDPLEVDAVYTRSDPHTVQSSLHPGKLARIHCLDNNEGISVTSSDKTYPQWFRPASVSQVEMDCLSRVFGRDAVSDEGRSRYLETRSKILNGEQADLSDYTVVVWSILNHLGVTQGSLLAGKDDDDKRRGVDICWGCSKDLSRVGNGTAFGVKVTTLSGHGEVLAVCRECAAAGRTPEGRAARLDGNPIRPPTVEEVTKIGAALAERSAAGVILLAEELQRPPEECLVIAAQESFERFDPAHREDSLIGADNSLMRLLGLLCAVVHPIVASSGARAAIEYIASCRKAGIEIDLEGKEILEACLRGAQEKARRLAASAGTVSRHLTDVLQARMGLAEQRVAWCESLDTAIVGEARLSQGVNQIRTNVIRLENELHSVQIRREEMGEKEDAE
ncbi:Ubiquitin carboxyl-terminal hydrolase 31 [Perkinsus chesapeaki]|uniref:Ubiquitin carboxyl-terminal hydrolase 31 n=1 Tax=Perkinsus chesapeaki TaxID=330153 RepID=A0A7J6LR98_PERCH|nr:Ubiquitin carboxyl-terminal hydrolase 31 [Perkinsus chesapeaki]